MTVAEVQAVLLPNGPRDEADQCLLEVLDRCREDIDVSEHTLHDALGAGPWGLRSVSIRGFRGAANGSGLPGASSDPLRVEFPRSSDVVVVHAPNGTGKSTIAEALEVALYGGTEHAPSFNPDDLRQPVAAHRDAAHSEVTVLLDNDRGDCLQVFWQRDGEDEHSEITWRVLGEPERDADRPGRNWVETMAANQPVVGYDHLTHRLRAGQLTKFVHDTLTLGSTWWDVWNRLRTAYRSAAAALDRWSAVRQEVVRGLADLDDDLTAQHPDVRVPDELVVPAHPSEDVSAWFGSTFTEERDSLLSLNVDRQLPREIAEARATAAASLRGYRQAQAHSEQQLWAGEGLSALRGLIDHTGEHPDDHCPVCGGAASDWREHAARTLHGLRVVREEFNLSQADLDVLATMLVDRLFPLLRSAWAVPAVAGIADELLDMIRPLCNQKPRTEHDAAWRAVTEVLEYERFDHDVERVVTALSSASDLLAHWQAARRERCAALVTVHAEHGAAATRVQHWHAALERVANAFETVHGERRSSVEVEVGRPLAALLADVDFGGIGLEVAKSTWDGLNESTTLRLSLDRRQVGMGHLSAGQYNALVLAMLLDTENSGPFRFLVLDDPVHAFDEFRTDVFTDLVARRAAGGRQIILLTHDQQLVEVMRNQVPGVCLVKLGRDEHGNVTQLDVSHPWQPLIADARRLLRSNAGNGDAHRVLTGTTAALLVLAFCRQAVDAVLREFVLETTRASEFGPRIALAHLGRALTTRKALRAARAYAHIGGSARPLIDALLAERDYLDDLNAGSHGAGDTVIDTPRHLSERIDRTERFCTELMGTMRP